METHIGNWGNSFGIRLPKALVRQYGLKKGSAVNITPAHGGGFMVKPAKRKKRRYTLEELCSRITPENMHSETDWGPPVGKEIIKDDWS